MDKSKILYVVFVAGLIGAIACNRPPKPQAPAPLSEEEKAMYLQQGQEIAQATFAAMSSRLQSALQSGGVPFAAQYCNTAALPIADSLSALYKARIRRTSLKIRNPQDRPDAAEKAALERYAAQWADQQPLKPSLEFVDEKTVAFYAPIKVNAFCLSCHGQVGSTLREADEAYLKTLYPEDQATGYQDGEWRGLWSIRFERK